MNCIIVEDQPPAQRILKRYIKDLGTLNLQGTFTDALQALTFLQSEKTDLIFLDIHLPKISGIEFIKTLPNAPSVILTTAFSEYALEGYDLNVVDYLLKPFSFERFVKAVAKVNMATSAVVDENISPSSVFIKSGHEYINIIIADILYIKSDMDYTEIHTNEKVHVSSETLTFWEQKLPAELFARVHKSYLVNISKIKKIAGSQLYLVNEKDIPIGRTYKEEFMLKYIM
jgi:DNA-binding LytR/AlgR family response regulator